MAKLKGAEIILECLAREGVEVVFGVPGGANLPLYDYLRKYPQIRHILVRHEQAASHAADAYARVTGKVGVCFATSGPGATNLITGIANAQLDSVPMVCITGQVVSPNIGKDAFQETDMTGISLPVTKHNYLVMDGEDLAPVMREAFHIARTGRPGPVLVDVPRDIQQQEYEFHWPERVSLLGYKPTLDGHPTQIKKAARLINEAERPLIIAGHGVIIAGAEAELRQLAERAQIPVTTTLLGIGGFPAHHVLDLGMTGMHGMAWANLALVHCDVMVAIGMRMDDRVTGKTSAFASQATIIHIDIDPAEIGKNVRAHVPIVGDARHVLKALLKEVEHRTHAEWLAQFDTWRRDHPSIAIRETEEMLPTYVVREIYEATKGEAFVTTGVGQHQMWAAQFYRFVHSKRWVTSGGVGTMGFGLPAALGVQAAFPDAPVWVIDGDGSFQMTLQELATVAQEKMPIKVAILNNGFLGMVRQWQELFYDRNYAATPMFNPDYVKLAEAFGLAGRRVERKEDVRGAIEWAMETPGCVILDFAVAPEENVYPMIPSGATVHDMIEEPAPARIELPGRSKEETPAWPVPSTR